MDGSCSGEFPKQACPFIARLIDGEKLVRLLTLKNR